MKNLILRMAVILTAAATLFYSGCDDGSDSDVTSGGNVDDLIEKTRGTNEPKAPEAYTLKVTITPTAGGTVSKSPDKPQYSKDETVVVTAAVKSGYRFVGWSGSQTSTSDEMVIRIKMDGNKELIANFLPENVVSYSLTLSASPTVGGSVSKSPDKLEYDAGEVVYVVATSKPGYAFTIWSGASSSKDSAITITMNDKKELTANFAPQGYKLTINTTPYLGGSVSRSPSKDAYAYNEQVTITATAESGYKFTGWSGASTSTNAKITVTMDGDKELTAKFELATYTVTFSANGGSGSVSSQSALSGNSITLPDGKNLTRGSYYFDGWNTNSSGTGTQYSAGSYYTVTGDVTLYAKWETTPTHRVTFNSQNGSSVSSQDVEDGKKMIRPTDPTRTGYTFGGWYKESGCTNAWNFDTDVVTTAITLYAKWSVAVVYGNSVNYGGKTYKTIKIGNLTWFAENLNYNVEGSVCYANNSSNCATYGRLYNWEAAMQACPSGWHLPSDAEWTQLENAVGGSSTVGRKLKSQSGWYNNGNGTDEYGFSALPGGAGDSDGSFDDAGGYGVWWSATEYVAGIAWFREMGYDSESVYRPRRDESRLFSVRCVAD